jgi:hypothetical protein
MLSEKNYFKLVSFFNVNSLPKLFKTSNNTFKWFFKKSIDFNQIFYNSVIISFSLFFLFFFLGFLSGFLGFNGWLLLFLGLIVSFFVFVYLLSFPSHLVRLRISDELSRATVVMSLLVSYLRVNPSFESVVKRVFGSRDDFVSRSFSRAVHRSVMGKRLSDELSFLAVRFGEFSHGFKRALYLIKQGISERDALKRGVSLDRALKVFLKEIEFNTRFFSQKLVSASFLVFTVGVILPLVGLSVLPLLNFFSTGVSLSVLFFSLVFISFLVFFITDRVLVNRPVVLYLNQSFEGDFSFKLLFSSLVVFVLVSFPSLMFVLLDSGFVSFGVFDSFVLFLGFLPFFWGLVLSFCFYFYFSSRDAIRKIVCVEELEKGLPDVIYTIASDLGEGLPLESSLLNVSKNFSGVLAKKLGKVRLLIKNSHFSVKNAFSKVFSDSNSFLVNGVFSFVGEEQSHSGVVSSSLFSLSEHLSDLRGVAQDLRVRLEHNLSMMQYSVLFFAPIICGLVVVLNSLISSSLSSLFVDLEVLGFVPGFLGFFSSNGVSSHVLSLISSLYLLVFTVVVSRFLVYVKNGQSVSILKFELSKILLMVAILYSLTLLVSRKMFGV